MKKFIQLMAFAFLTFSLPLAAADELPIPAKEAELLKGVTARGYALYHYDQAAWHTTDAMREDIKDPAKAGIRGWVVTENDQGWLVTYWKKADDGYAGVYSAVWTGEAVADRKKLSGETVVLSEEQKRLIVAGQAIDLSKIKRCSKASMNMVILPVASEDELISVYLLTPQTKTGSFPMGGHHRFDIKNGKVVGERGFMKSCMELDYAKVGKKGGPAALMLTHLFDRVPTEIHAFAVYTARLPVFVIAQPSGYLWEVGLKGGKPNFVLLKDMNAKK